jgi:hypothetical protein
MPQYGRNVQKMVEYLLTIEDREKRLQQAKLVIELMSLLTPHLKTMEDYEHKLWDHLHQMTNFRLDVDAPFPAPTKEQIEKKPEPLSYPKKVKKFRHLGSNLQALVKKGVEDTDPEKKQGYVQTVGYYMKLAYANWHKEPVHDDMIKQELHTLSDGHMAYESNGVKVHFDHRKNFKNNNNRNFKNNNNNNNRKFNNGNSKNQKNRNFKNKS